MISAKTSLIKDDGSSLLLMIMPSDALLAEQRRIISNVPGQVSVNELHITLMRSPWSDKPLPVPPVSVELENEARLVSDGDKTSVYIPVSRSSQLELARYVAAIEETLNESGLQNKERIFHVSLSNLKGPPGESVANVWEHASKPV